MTSLSSRTMVLCFNLKDEAQKLGEKLREMDPTLNFIISINFNDLLEIIGKEKAIDCFIVEEDFKEYPSAELLMVLRKSHRYQKTAFALFSPDLSLIDKKYLQIDINYMFDLSTEIIDVVSSIKRIIDKILMPIIPANFKVMVLDNNHEFLEIMTMHLQDMGHHDFHLCHSINEAKLFLLKNDYDILLLDWNLDDGTCLDIIEFIQSSPISARTKKAVKMVITGRNEVEDIMTLLNYGIKDYLIKPFEYSEFENKLDYALEKNLRRTS